MMKKIALVAKTVVLFALAAIVGLAIIAFHAAKGAFHGTVEGISEVRARMDGSVSDHMPGAAGA